MRTKGTIVIGMVMMLMLLSGSTLAAVSPAANADKQEGVATLVVKQGQVEVQRATEKIKATKGMLLFEGDMIKTRELSRAALLLQDGSLIRLNENTDLELKINAKKAKQNRLKVMIGHLWAKIKKQDSGLEIETPSAVAAIKGTELELVVQLDSTELIVWDGLVKFLNELGEQMVAASQRSSALRGKGPSQPVHVDLDQLNQWFNSVVDVPASKTFKTTIRDKNGKEQKLDIKYNKK